MSIGERIPIRLDLLPLNIAMFYVIYCVHCKILDFFNISTIVINIYKNTQKKKRIFTILQPYLNYLCLNMTKITLILYSKKILF